MEFLNQLLCFAYQHPVLALLIAGLVITFLAVVAESIESGGSSSPSASHYTSQIDHTGSQARQQMDQTSAAYRSEVRNTIRR